MFRISCVRGAKSRGQRVADSNSHHDEPERSDSTLWTKKSSNNPGGPQLQRGSVQQAQAFVSAAALPREPSAVMKCVAVYWARSGGVLQVEGQHTVDNTGARAWVALA